MNELVILRFFYFNAKLLKIRVSSIFVILDETIKYLICI